MLDVQCCVFMFLYGDKQYLFLVFTRIKKYDMKTTQSI
jgi:hypothetical protein